MCGECNTVAAPGNYDLTVKCCTCYACGEPLPKDERVPYAEGTGKSLYHRECERKRRAERDAQLLEEAELVTEYDGPVYFEGGRGSFGEGYFSNAQELSEHFDKTPSERPLFAHTCTSRGFALDADSILESALEEMYDDCQDDLGGMSELYDAIAVFNEANSSVETWDADYKHKVAVPIS